MTPKDLIAAITARGGVQTLNGGGRIKYHFAGARHQHVGPTKRLQS